MSERARTLVPLDSLCSLGTPFDSHGCEYLSDDEYRKLQQALIADPEMGPVIPGSGGIRKVRWGIADFVYRFGRKPVMITARVLFLLAIYPAFTLMIANRDVVTLVAATGLLSALSSSLNL